MDGLRLTDVTVTVRNQVMVTSLSSDETFYDNDMRVFETIFQDLSLRLTKLATRYGRCWDKLKQHHQRLGHIQP